MKRIFLALALASISASSQAQTPATAVKVGEWTAVGEIAKVSASENAGRKSVRFEYTVDKRFHGLLALPIDGGLQQSTGLELTVTADGNRTVAAMLDEAGGGRWTAIFSAPKDARQKVQLSLSDFFLNQGENDPKDANGKLDADKIQSVVVVDVDTFLGEEQNATSALFFPDYKTGPRALTLEGFRFTSAPLKPTLLDGVGRPQAGWLPVGGTTVKNVAESPLGGPALEARYKSGAARIGGMIRPIPLHALAGKSALTIALASETATTVRLQLEDDRGAKWDTAIELAGGSVKKIVRLRLADWQPSQDSKEPDAKMDLARIKQITLADITGLASPKQIENVVWVASLKAE